ncbi:MAG TPA: hypothetical protein VLV48_01710 [Thermoanaerobaculia bacterium]|nr:hypothetical protein [Thermoanaerobaculia bacterium]
MSNLRLRVLVALLAAALAGALPVSAQARRIKKIEKPPAPAAPTPATPATPAPAAPAPAIDPAVAAPCREAVGRIAASYGPDMGAMLHREFPNREHFLDELRRADLRATRLALIVESIESIRVEPSAEDSGVESIDCIADVRTRLTWDDPDTGERTVEEPGRAEWRIRLPHLETLP